MNVEIASWLAELKTRCPSIQSVWLIGSRANKSAHAASDWDFIAFGNSQSSIEIESSSELHRLDVDFLLVVNGNDFSNAWGIRDKRGTLSSWEWILMSNTHAEYTETKWVETETEDGAKLICQRRIATRV